MKTKFKINEKAITESCNKAIEHRKNAIVNFKKAMMIMTCLFMFCMFARSQDFEKINFLGKTSTQISTKPVIVQDCMFNNTNHYKNGDLFISYLSPEFGTILYIFDTLNYCKKIMVYSQPGRKLIINQAFYNILTVTDSDKVVYSIRPKKKQQ